MALADTILVPGVFVTVDNSLANTALGAPFKTVLFGQKTAAGTATAETLVQVFSDAGAKAQFGVGSMLANMLTEWFKNNGVNEVHVVALDDAAGTSEETEITFGGSAATGAGSIFLYINGKRIVVPIASGDIIADISSDITDAINADVDLPVTAAFLLNVVTLTAKNDGTVCGQVDVRLNNGVDEVLPGGITLTSIAQSVAGATDPDINDAIAALPDEIFNLVVNPYTDATSLTALDAELARRWSNTVQLDGHAINAFGGTSSAVVTKGDGLNSEHLTFMDSGKATMVPAYLVSAEAGGRIALSASEDPARPFRTLSLTGMIGDDPTDRRTFSEKNSILNSGISTHVVQPDSTVSIDRLLTTYKTNAVGAVDTSYRNTNTMFNLSFMRQSFKIRMLSLYPRHKLADDGTAFGAGQPIATPSGIKGNVIALYQDWINLGLAEDIEAFADALVVERDTVNRSRINITMQPVLIGQLYQFDTTLQFIV